MRLLRWTWPMVLGATIVVVPWMLYRAAPPREVALVVVDKTVPFRTWVEHRSLFWLLDHLRLVQPGGEPYLASRDYVGAHPPAVAGDPPERTDELGVAQARTADLVYLADTYGVYRDDLASGEAMQAALERSPRVYGGLGASEVAAARAAAHAGAVVVSEFNTLGSPTPAGARAALEQLHGVRWTGWIGRFFTELSDAGEVPAWVRRNYEREWRTPWTFRGPGWVLLQDDAACEVLRVGHEVAAMGLTLQRERPLDRLMRHARDGTPYPYWFDVVTVAPSARALASFQWNLTPAGTERLRARGLPLRFPAVVRAGGGRGAAFYFAGDFADNPQPAGAVPLAGYLTLRRWIEGARLAPSEDAFYWAFYVPMMAAMLDEVEARRRARAALVASSTGAIIAPR